MTDQEKIFKAFEDTIWAAIRYANGRHTPAPSMVRDSIKLVQEVYPDWKPKFDHTIKADMESGWAGNEGSLPSDYLVDLFEDPEHSISKSEKTTARFREGIEPS